MCPYFDSEKVGSHDQDPVPSQKLLPGRFLLPLWRWFQLRDSSEYWQSCLGRFDIPDSKVRRAYAGNPSRDSAPPYEQRGTESQRPWEGALVPGSRSRRTSARSVCGATPSACRVLQGQRLRWTGEQCGGAAMVQVRRLRTALRFALLSLRQTGIGNPAASSGTRPGHSSCLRGHLARWNDPIARLGPKG